MMLMLLLLIFTQISTGIAANFEDTLSTGPKSIFIHQPGFYYFKILRISIGGKSTIHMKSPLDIHFYNPLLIYSNNGGKYQINREFQDPKDFMSFTGAIDF